MPFLLAPGPLEWGLIFAAVVILFGATRIGDIGGAIGRGIRDFRREVRESENESKEGEEEDKEQTAAETSEEKRV